MLTDCLSSTSDPHLNYELFQDLHFDLEDYYTFTVIRQPATRLVSAYIDKIVLSDEEQFREIRNKIASINGVSVSDITFVHFLKYLTTETSIDKHFKKQVTFFDKKLINKILTVEKLDQQWVDLPNPFPASLKRLDFHSNIIFNSKPPIKIPDPVNVTIDQFANILKDNKIINLDEMERCIYNLCPEYIEEDLQLFTIVNS